MAEDSGVGFYGTISVGVAATQIVDGTTKRASVVIQNVHATQTLYLGTDAAVTVATGLRVAAGGSAAFDDYLGPIFGIGSGAATDTRFFEIGA